MNSLVIALGAAILYVIAYYTYGRFLGRKIFKLTRDNICPSEALRDDHDYVPTHKHVLFGHHFASIAGTGPIVGPAVAIIWGWVPALLWIVFGSIFMGAVHDLGSLVVSLRNQGRSIGDIAGDLISPRVRTLFLLIIFFLLLLVVAVFGVVIGLCFKMYPQAVIPVWGQIPIALALGYLVYKKNMNAILLGAIAVILMYVTIVLGAYNPISMPEITNSAGETILDPISIWIVLLLIYVYIASTLPVQTLLQPRDYINSWQLLVAMILLGLGVIVAHPQMAAPSFRTVADAPPMLPTLFVVVACGALSGFHSLVASGTSAKQCDNEHNAIYIGYGSMLVEGMLAVFVLVACGAGIALAGGGVEAYTEHYKTWAAANGGLGVKLGAFVSGSTAMIDDVGIPTGIATTLMGVFIVSFAATSLDSATRIQRYIVSELAGIFKISALTKKHPATLFAVGTAAILAFFNGSGRGAMQLWPLFGCLNQLLGGLALLVITIYLVRQGVAIIYTALPMVFMILMTGWAMYYNVVRFYNEGSWILLAISVIIVFFEVWMIVESISILRRTKST
jgi:carbon starvation protein